jgi:hypothetical protein
MLTVSGKALGRKKPLFADFSIAPPPETRGDDGITLRHFIEHVVRAEVGAFRQRQRDRLELRVLSARQIDEGREKGKIDSGASDVGLQEIDVEAAVGTALQAFEDGLYLVVIDDQQQRDLDRQVILRPDSRVTFVRLTLLAGG